MPRHVFLLALLAPLALPARIADACSCGGDVFVQPSDGATDVPLNAGVFLVKNDADRVALYRQSDALRIPLTVEDDESASLYRNVFARPAAPLDPSTTYEIKVLADDDRPHELVAAFTTGTTTDELAPTFSGVTAVRPRLWRREGRYSSCWTRPYGDDDIVLEHELPADDIAGFIVELRREDEPQPSFRSLVATSIYPDVAATPYSHLRGDHCSYTGVPVLTDGTTYCGRVIAFDRAGNRSGAAAEVCSPAVTCALVTDNFVSPSDVCAEIEFTPPSNDGGTATPADSSSGGCTMLPTRAARAPLAVILAAAALVLRRRRRPLNPFSSPRPQALRRRT